MALALVFKNRETIRSLASIFFAALSSFAYLLVVTPLVSALLVSSLPLYLLQTAPMLAMAAAVVLSQFFKNRSWIFSQRTVLFLSMIALAASFLLLSLIQTNLDHQMLAIAPGLKAFLIEQVAVYVDLKKFDLLAMLTISLPFIFYGLFLSLSFNAAPEGKLHQFYALELAGILSGSVLGCLFLDYTSMRWSLILIFLSGGVAFTLSHDRSKAWVRRSQHLCLVILLGVAALSPEIFEPHRNLNLVYRDFALDLTIEELKTSWTSFAKVQTLAAKELLPNGKVIAIGAGTGHARIFNPSNADTPERLLVALHPKTSLVLFAGAGADILGARNLSDQALEIDGVELNRRLIEHAQEIQPETPPLILADARTYLRKTTKKYDCILYSWSGATLAHHSGAILHTTQFAFTTEGIADALARLNPGGFLILLGASKYNLLLSLKRLGLPTAPSTVLLTRTRETWLRGWDDNILIYKNGVLNSSEVEALRLNSGRFDLVYPTAATASPSLDPLTYDLVRSPNYATAKAILESGARGLFFDAHSDDRPYVYSVRPLRNFSALLKSIFSLEGEERESVILITMLIAAAIFVLLGPAWQGGLQMVVTGSLSAGLMQLAVYCLLFEIGNPTWSIALAQFLLIFSFLGAYFAPQILRWPERKRGLSGVGLVFLAVVILPGWTFGTQANFFLMALSALGLFCSSAIFGVEFRNLRIQTPHLLNYALALNILAAAVLSLFLSLLIENLGLTFSFRLMAALVLTSLALAFRSQRRPS